MQCILMPSFLSVEYQVIWLLILQYVIVLPTGIPTHHTFSQNQLCWDCSCTYVTQSHRLWRVHADLSDHSKFSQLHH
jgi:hypothetical protein